MMRVFISRIVGKVLGLVFADQVRPIELASAINLFAWALLLSGQPDLIERDSYIGFRNLGVVVWATMMFVIAGMQICPLFLRQAWVGNLRILANVLAGGVWLTVALSFIASNVVTTADANYLILSILCLTSGVFLGWKTAQSTP